MSHLCPSSSWRQNLTAVLGIVLVVWLNLLVASPSLHAWLHHHGSVEVAAAQPAAADGDQHQEQTPVGSPEHHCVVTLFAGGVEPLVLLAFCGLLWVARCVAVLRPEAARLFRALPRYWHVPAHGPPLA